MTAERLQNIALRLANQCPTRYWLMLDYPKAPGRMAIGIIDRGNVESLNRDLCQLGFEQLADDLSRRMGVDYAWTIVRDTEAIQS